MTLSANCKKAVWYKLYGNSDKKIRLLPEHWRDLASHAHRDNRPYFTEFLPVENAAELEKIAACEGVICTLWGGIEAAARVMACFSPPEIIIQTAQFPICCLTIMFRTKIPPRHQDFLGAFMGCNLERSVIGDILIGENMAQVFVCRHVGTVIMQEVQAIGRASVSITDRTSVCLTAQTTFMEISGTVASLRADAVVAFVAHLSREKAVQLIRQGRLFRGVFTVESPSMAMQVGDVFSIRGYGKFRIDAVDGVTRKGRYHITIQKYQ